MTTNISSTLVHLYAIIIKQTHKFHTVQKSLKTLRYRVQYILSVSIKKRKAKKKLVHNEFIQSKSIKYQVNEREMADGKKKLFLWVNTYE